MYELIHDNCIQALNNMTDKSVDCIVTDMPSKLDPYLTRIENWLAAEPQLTALAVVRRLAAIDTATFSDKQHSIVQRLLRSLRRRAAQTVIAIVTQQASILPAGPVDGSSCHGSSAPPTGPPAELDSQRRQHRASNHAIAPAG